MRYKTIPDLNRAAAARNGPPAGQNRRIGAQLRRAGATVVSGFLAAIGAAVLVTVPARALMRLAALAVGERTHFSWTGTLGIAVIFTVAMLPGALLATAWTGRGRSLGLAAGAALLCFPATGVAAEELGTVWRQSTARMIEALAASVGVYGCLAALPLLSLRIVRALAPASIDPESGKPSGRRLLARRPFARTLRPWAASGFRVRPPRGASQPRGRRSVDPRRPVPPAGG